MVFGFSIYLIAFMIEILIILSKNKIRYHKLFYEKLSAFFKCVTIFSFIRLFIAGISWTANEYTELIVMYIQLRIYTEYLTIINKISK